MLLLVVMVAVVVWLVVLLLLGVGVGVGVWWWCVWGGAGCGQWAGDWATTSAAAAAIVDPWLAAQGLRGGGRPAGGAPPPATPPPALLPPAVLLGEWSIPVDPPLGHIAAVLDKSLYRSAGAELVRVGRDDREIGHAWANMTFQQMGCPCEMSAVTGLKRIVSAEDALAFLCTGFGCSSGPFVSLWSKK